MFMVDKSQEDEEVSVSSRLFGVLILGFLLVFVGILILAVASFSGGSGSFSAVIFIGPFPIVFGAGPDVYWLILIGILLAILSIVFFYVLVRKKRLLGY